MIPIFSFQQLLHGYPSPALPRTRLHKELRSLPSVPAHLICQLLVHCNSSCFNFDLLSPAHNRPYHGEARFSKSLHSRESYASHLGQSTKQISRLDATDLYYLVPRHVLFCTSITLPLKCTT